MSSNKLEQIIRQYVSLPAYPNSKGWFPVLCKVCNDRGHKGKRAAFNFDIAGTGYNCFNCGHKAVYDPIKDEALSDSMKMVLRSFNVPETEWGVVLYDALVARHNGVGHPTTTLAPVNYDPDEIQLPAFFYKLVDDPKDEIAQYAIEYLWRERKIKWADYPFMLSANGLPNNKWYGRLIIPIYKDGKCIFYTGRDLTDTKTRKYETPSVQKDNILFGFDQLKPTAPRSLPLYIVEGWFDAFNIEGVAVFGNRLTKGQIYWLNTSPRPKVVIPDRTGDGHQLALTALDLGWSISTPDVGQSKDMSEAVKKYGLMYVLNSIREHTSSGLEARTKLGVYCE